MIGDVFYSMALLDESLTLSLLSLLRKRPGLGMLLPHHLCPSIGALLRTLQILRLRMCSICPDVLKTRGPDTKLRLSTVAINLGLS
jgi:hypothetical protein